MDPAHAHLILNHLPILGTFFGLCLLAYGLFRKKKELENAGLVTLVIVALLTIPVFFSGEGAEEIVEHIPGVSEQFLEQHEELAETALWLMIATGAASLLTIIIPYLSDSKNTMFRIIPLLLAAITFAMMVMVGNYGGKIRHSELRNDSVEQVEQNED
ncbi:MAG: hypothetical protein ABJG78_01820 [Cyclobacteriaceae bacterium]